MPKALKVLMALWLSLALLAACGDGSGDGAERASANGGGTRGTDDADDVGDDGGDRGSYTGRDDDDDVGAGGGGASGGSGGGASGGGANGTSPGDGGTGGGGTGGGGTGGAGSGDGTGGGGSGGGTGGVGGGGSGGGGGGGGVGGGATTPPTGFVAQAHQVCQRFQSDLVATVERFTRDHRDDLAGVQRLEDFPPHLREPFIRAVAPDVDAMLDGMRALQPPDRRQEWLAMLDAAHDVLRALEANPDRYFEGEDPFAELDNGFFDFGIEECR